MAERFKKIPFSHKLFGAITTAGLVACGVGEKIGIVTPPPEGTATNPPPTEITPTLENQTVFGSGEFMTGDPALSEMLQTSLREGFNIEIPEEATIPFSLKVGEAKFDFVSLAPLENTELGISWNEKLFIKVNDTLADLDRQEVTIDGNNLIMWSYLNTNNNQMEPVLWYPSLTNQEWESLTPEQKSNFYAGFAPPSPLETQVPGYTRTLDQVFTIAFGELPESALKVRAALRPLTPVPEGLNNLPEGFVPVRNEDGTWGIGREVNGETVAIPGINFSQDKLMINLGDGETLDITDDINAFAIIDHLSGAEIMDIGERIGYVWKGDHWTEILLQIKFETDGTKFSEFPEVTYEDITSGALAEAERLAAQPFPEGVKPVSNYYHDLNYGTIYPDHDPQTSYEFSIHPEKYPMRFVYFYQATVNNVSVVVATLQVLNQDYSSVFIHMVESRDFLNSQGNWWNDNIQLQRLPIFSLALGGTKYDYCENGWSEAAKQVCVLNSPQDNILQEEMQEWMAEQKIPEVFERVFLTLESGRWY